ncbi:MAG: GNAT family N-acetyltransferase [Longicatena sp.]
MQVRDMQDYDFPIYLAMAEDFYSGDAAVEPVNPNNFKNTFEQLMNKTPYLRGVMMCVDNVVIGYALFGFYWSCEKGQLFIFLDELYIKEEARGQQNATKFFAWLEKEYHENAHSFRLEVNPDNPRAKALYERLGYRVSPYIQMVK